MFFSVCHVFNSTVPVINQNKIHLTFIVMVMLFTTLQVEWMLCLAATDLGLLFCFENESDTQALMFTSKQLAVIVCKHVSEYWYAGTLTVNSVVFCSSCIQLKTASIPTTCSQNPVVFYIFLIFFCSLLIPQTCNHAV